MLLMEPGIPKGFTCAIRKSAQGITLDFRAIFEFVMRSVFHVKCPSFRNLMYIYVSAFNT